MTPNTFIRQIIVKYNRGEDLTEEENTVFQAWRESVLSGEADLDVFAEEGPEEEIQESFGKSSEPIWGKVQELMAAKTAQEKEMKMSSGGLSRWVKTAGKLAAVLILIAAAVFWYNKERQKRYPHPAETAGIVSWETVAPGHYHGKAAGPAGTEIIDSSMNTQWKPFPQTLPDGSTVTLSYGSSLRYSEHFTDSVREVRVEGQAYFNIAKDSRRPFTVYSGSDTVEVMGTSFNWMHYPGVSGEITLLSGKVKIKYGGKYKDLNPGDQAVISDGQGRQETDINVQQSTDPNGSISWMKTYPTIEFENEELYTVVQRLANYFGVGVRWSPDVKNGPILATLVLRNSLDQNVKDLGESVKRFARVELKGGAIQVTKNLISTFH